MICLYYNDTCYDIFVANNSLDFFWNAFSNKAIKVCHTITIRIQSYPVSSYWILLIKFSYVSPILQSVWQIISWINTFEFSFMLIILLYFKISQMMRYNSKSCPALITPSPAQITPLHSKIFPNKLTPIASSNILRNLPHSFISF